MTERRPSRLGIASTPGHGTSTAALALAWLAGTAFAITFAWLSVARHRAFQSHAFDLGNMDQAVWSTLHGHLLRFTNMDVGGSVLTSRLAIHVEPLLVAAAPLYALRASPETLLIAQAVIVATGAVPAYLIARGLLQRTWLALVFPVAYVCHPTVQNVVLDDFHAVALSAAFILWALYFLLQNRALPFVAMSALALMTKEEVSLVVALIGCWAVWRGLRVAGVLCVAVGTGWFVTCIAIVIPHFNPAHHSPYLARYGYLGHGIAGIIRGVLTHPRTVLHVLTSTDRLQYLLNLIHSLGFTPILALPVTALAVPVLLINMLSSDDTMYSGFYQYSAEVVPIAVAAAAVGIGSVGRSAIRLRAAAASWLVPALCTLVLLASLIDCRVYGFTPLSDGYLVPTTGNHQRAEASAIARIPSSAVVAAADEMEPHVAERSWVYTLPTTHPRNGPRAGWIVLDASIPSLPVTPRELQSVANRSLHGGYGVVSASDGVLLLHLGAGRHALPPAFYSFLFRPPTHFTPLHVSWGRLQLTGCVIHPRSGVTNRSRPAIGLETYWLASGPLPARLRISFRLSTVYNGAHPRFSRSWAADSDSPAWDWLPFDRWPARRAVRADSLSLLPPADAWGTVDIAVEVSGMGPVTVRGSGVVSLGTRAVRLGSVAVRP